MRKNVIWNSTGTILYFFCQWLLTILLVKLTGNDFATTGYLTLAMTMSSSYSTIALFNMRSFQVSDIKKEFQDATYMGSRIITSVLAFLCGGGI